MKDLNASVSGVAKAPVSEVFAFLSDVVAYPSWYPDGVKEASLIDEGRCRAVLSVNQGPIQREFKMHMAIERVPESSITLRRLAKTADDQEQLAVTWRLAPDAGDGGRTALTAQFAATLSIPRFLPLGGIEKAIPQGFLDAALASLNR